VAIDDTTATAEDTPLAIPAAALLANDTDVDGPTLAITAVGGASNGAVSLSGATITFTPAADFAGTASFTYTVSDGTLIDTGAVTVTVTPVNDAPVAATDTASTPADTPLVLAHAALLANDTDVDGPALAIASVQGAMGGTVTLGVTTVTFTPDPGYVGPAAFDYTVTDGTATATATVAVTVTAGPVCGDGTVTPPTEACDDGDTTGGDGCSPACQVEPGWSCTGAPSTCVTVCGDSVVVAAGGEECDDGGTTPGDGCSPTCQLEDGCGDGNLDPGEECDDDNTVSGDGCSATCQRELQSIAIRPTPITIDQQQRVQLRAIGTFFGGVTSDVTATAAWSTSDAAIAIVGTGGVNNGRVDSLTTAGTATITATIGAISGSLPVAVTAATCHLRISEVQVIGDGVAFNADEFSELHNPCTFTVNVAGWNLVYRAFNGASDISTTTVPLAGTMAPGSFRLYVGFGYNGGGTPDGTFGTTATGNYAGAGGGLAIRSGPANTGAIVDSVGWGTAVNAYIEGAVAPAPPANRSIVRSPYDGKDSNNNAADFVVTDPTATPPTFPTPRATSFP
jgi:cysteine-rich repeat protein